jgi:hypothetical protein
VTHSFRGHSNLGRAFRNLMRVGKIWLNSRPIQSHDGIFFPLLFSVSSACT